MISFRVRPPYCISLFTTFRCNAACENCCSGCRPNRGATMSLEQMKRYVDLCIAAYPDTITRLALTGGECFLLGDDLKEIIQYGTRKGLSVDVISNGYWGQSYRNAFNILTELKKAGLKEITFSTGKDHQKWVPLKSCRNAAVAAARLGIKCFLRVEVHSGKVKCEKQMQEDVPFWKLIQSSKIGLTWWTWRKYNNEFNHGLYHPYRHRPYESKSCGLLFRDINITPYGDVLACCGISSMRIPQMRLGNIEKEPVRTIYERAFQDALKRWIDRKGPQSVLQYVYDNSDIRFHQIGPGCDSCNEIFGNPKIIPFLQDRYDDWIDRLKYEFI